MSEHDFLAYLILASVWLFIAGPVLFSRKNVRYIELVGVTAGISVMFASLVGIIFAVSWAVEHIVN